MAVSAILLASCSDFLDTVPPTSIPTNTAIQSVTEAEAAINGLYNIMQRNTYYNHYYMVYGDIRGDDIQSNLSTQVSWHLYTYNHDIANAASISTLSGNFWFQPMHLSRNASQIIDAIEKGKVTDGTEKERNAIKGHAIALRAMAHFDQLKVFGHPYAQDQGKSWGAIIIDRVLPDDELPLRSTVDQSFDFITSELEKAIPIMSDEKTSYNMLNSFGARALLARAYLYWEKNDKAFDTASALIEELKLSRMYRLYSRSEYANAFAYNSTGTNFNPESLLEVYNIPSDNPGRNGNGYMYHRWGYNAIMATRDFLNLINEDMDDIRHSVIDYYDSGAPWLRKYPGEGNQAAFDNNYPIIRLSEVYLIAAEAAAKQTDATKRATGLGYLNDIVKRANPANEVLDADYNLDRVLKERRLELIGEGHRYFDLLRNGKKWTRQGGYHWDAATSVGEISWDLYKCVMPIPSDQFVLNPDLKTQQNAGYRVE